MLISSIIHLSGNGGTLKMIFSLEYILILNPYFLKKYKVKAA